MKPLVPASLRWFEPLFVRTLRHEYRTAMTFDSTSTVGDELRPTKEACQLYVHVPFCEVLCPFCSFHRVRFREDKGLDYFEALKQEIRYYHERGFQFSNVYIGGGTPTVAPDELAETIYLIRSLWPVRSVAVETNPNHLHDSVLNKLAEAGVSRLSVGVQSFNDHLLKQMDRYAKYGSSELIQERIASAMGRFQTLNVDMIFDLPNQSLADLDRDLDVIHALKVDQVSFYPLMTAPTARRRMAQTLGVPVEMRRYEFYQRILERMLTTYEASTAWCFSRGGAGQPVAIDEYIVDHGDYVGVGSGSFSYVDGVMYSTTFSINQYLQRIARGQTGVTQLKRLTPKERMRYDYLVRLFGLELSKEYIRLKYGSSFDWLMAPELYTMRLVGGTRHDRDAIRLTRRGMYYWIIMMSEFFNSVNFFRDQMRLHIRDELAEYDRDEALVPIAQLGRKLGAP